MADIIAFPVERIRPSSQTAAIDEEIRQAFEDPVKFRKLLQFMARVVAEEPTDEHIKAFVDLSAYFVRHFGQAS